jgi:5-methylcytosine-specific restriction protein A
MPTPAHGLTRPSRPCSVQGCWRLIDGSGSKCREHQRRVDADRRQRHNHGATHGSARWRRERAAFLAQPGNELCRYCLRRGLRTPATLIDHADAAKGNASTFWDRSRWVPACGRCNRVKGIEREGALGRAPAGDGAKWQAPRTATELRIDDDDTLPTWG